LILYPPNSSKDQYMLYCLLTISALVLMSFIQKADIEEDPFENNNSDSDLRLVTYEPFYAYFLLPLILFLNTNVYHTLFSLAMMANLCVLLFLKINNFYFKFVKFVVMPTTLITLLWVYLSNLTGLFTTSDVEEYKTVLYLFQYSATVEILVSFAGFFAASWTVTMGCDFNQDYFIMAIADERSEFYNRYAPVSKLRELYLLESLGFVLMMLVLIDACIEVTLFNVILIY